MDIYINNENDNYDKITLTKMKLIYNAINDGWCVEKINNNLESEKYVFKKKHKNQKEIFSNNYLDNFINNYLKK
jgi:hypothetical protein